MTPQEERILDLAQSISLARTGRRSDVGDDEERDELIDDTIDWVNQYIEELELEADWNFVRSNHHEIGFVDNALQTSFDLPERVQRLVFSSERDLAFQHDGATVSTFRLVSPNQIADPTTRETRDRATVIGRKVVISRPTTEAEINAMIVADIVERIPRLSRENIEMLDLVEPRQLIVLGTAKNWSLPDIVQGEISPTLSTKYTDLLNKALARNDATAQAYDFMGEDFSHIRGVW